ncbi:MAG: RagB/SusD family nutrient uptake outer membrane protein [Candidatus Symbiothrix sp.]|jgi:hypothetical protein|nr:RagB/SusD family nutrient uptake outer membrane protein [Candidatus Symbiothrix sp.]
MKKIINITSKCLLVFALLIIGSACNDGFLDRTPVTDLNNADFWKTENDLKVFNNGIYNLAATNTYPFFRGNATGASESKYLSFMGMEAVSDNFASTDANLQVWVNIGSGKEVIPASATTTTGTSWRWEFLYRCNYFLGNYEKATGVAESVRNNYAGETYFWRAWFYFDKVQEYGDVPIITHVLDETSPELFAKQDPRKDVMALVIADIDKAIAYLPTAWPTTNPDRVTKWTALALKSRICLYEGTYRKYHALSDATDYNGLLTQAAAAAKEIIDNGPYIIYNTGKPTTDYRTLFTTLDLRSNKEVILPKLYAIPGMGHAVSANLGGTTKMLAGVTKDLVDDFLCTDGKPIALSSLYSDNTIENVFDNRDPRLAQTALDPRRENEMLGSSYGNFPRFKGMSSITWETLSGYYYVKNFNKAERDLTGSTEVTDFPVLRYAEVLLNYAEAKAELGAIAQGDLDVSIKLLRDRAGMPNLTLTPEMDPKYASEGLSALLVEIRRERRVELSFENLRYHDLMRWKKGAYLNKPVLGMRLEDADKATGGRYAGATAATVEVDGKKYVNVYAGTTAATRSFNENKNYLHPIPTNVRAKNPNLTQTPGWTE